MSRAFLYGLIVEFDQPEKLLQAARAARSGGYRRIEAYSPFPVDGLAEVVGFKINWLAWLVLFAGFGGAALGYGMQWYANVVSYPLNIAGRPHHSWPSFIPITFEIGVLSAALVGFFGMIFLCGLPRPHHPVFSLPRFSQEMRGRFFLCIRADDPLFHARRTERFLTELGGTVHPVEDEEGNIQAVHGLALGHEEEEEQTNATPG